MNFPSVLLSMFMLFAGCAINHNITETKDVPQLPSIIARYSETPVLIDGCLDDPVWQVCPWYEFSSPGKFFSSAKHSNRQSIVNRPLEKGQIKIAWDKTFLYIGAKLNDTDIVQEKEENQSHQYATGDTLEIFLKPEKNTWYWEIYGTPNCKKTVFFIPGRGRSGLPGIFVSGMNLDNVLVGTQIKGTLNNWKDVDEYWTIEMAIPLNELKKHGDTFDSNSKWRVLIGRYNYSRYLPWMQLSTVPHISEPNFHLYEEYGILLLEK